MRLFFLLCLFSAVTGASAAERFHPSSAPACSELRQLATFAPIENRYLLSATGLVADFARTLVITERKPASLQAAGIAFTRTDPRSAPNLDVVLACFPRLQRALNLSVGDRVLAWNDWPVSAREQLRLAFDEIWTAYERNEFPQESWFHNPFAAMAQAIAAEAGSWFTWSVLDWEDQDLQSLLHAPSSPPLFAGKVAELGWVTKSRLQTIGRILKNEAPDRVLKALQAVNIAARALHKCGETQLYFPSERMYLTDLRDPSHPFVTKLPGELLLVPESTWRAWFGHGRCEASGRKPLSLALTRLPEPLLNLRCLDRNNGTSRSEGQVFKTFASFLSYRELDALGLWKKLDEKIARRGGCAKITSGEADQRPR